MILLLQKGMDQMSYARLRAAHSLLQYCCVRPHCITSIARWSPSSHTSVWHCVLASTRQPQAVHGVLWGRFVIKCELPHVHGPRYLTFSALIFADLRLILYRCYEKKREHLTAFCVAKFGAVHSREANTGSTALLQSYSYNVGWNTNVISSRPHRAPPVTSRQNSSPVYNLPSA